MPDNAALHSVGKLLAQGKCRKKLLIPHYVLLKRLRPRAIDKLSRLLDISKGVTKNEKKAAILYDFLDSSKLFKGTVRKEDRSVMNVPFITGDEELDAKFVAESKAAGMENLKGHRTVGGMRASIYNAMPKAGVEKLVSFMEDFEKKNLK